MFINHDLRMALTYFMHLNRENVKMSFERKNLQEIGKWIEDV